MPKASDYIPDKRIFGLLKGDPGCGKSIAAATFALNGPQYIFDFDGKFAAIYNFFTNIIPCPEIIANIEYDRFSNYNDAAEKLQHIIDYEPNKYTGGVVWDTLTTCVDSILTQVQTIKGADPNKKGKLKMVGGIQVGDIEDYNAESAALTRMIQAAKFHLPVHFLMLAHVVRIETPQLKGGIKITRQLLTAGKKVAAKLPAYFDESWHLTADEGSSSLGGNKYLVRTTASGEDWARTSLPLPATMDVTGKKFLWKELQKELHYEKL